MDAGNPVRVDDVDSVDAPDLIGIQFFDQLSNTFLIKDSFSRALTSVYLSSV